MSDKFLDYEGLSTYNRTIRKYIKNRTPEATEDKKGLLKISDLPAYISNRTLKFSGAFTVGAHSNNPNNPDILYNAFSFLSKDSSGMDYSTGEIDDSITFPSYTIMLDGKVYEHVICSGYSGTWNSFTLYYSASKWVEGEVNSFEIIYGAGTEDHNYSTLDVTICGSGSEEDGTEHQLEIYQEGQDEIHQLDEKYIPNTIARINDIPSNDVWEIVVNSTFSSSQLYFNVFRNGVKFTDTLYAYVTDLGSSSTRTREATTFTYYGTGAASLQSYRYSYISAGTRGITLTVYLDANYTEYAFTKTFSISKKADGITNYDYEFTTGNQVYNYAENKNNKVTSIDEDSSNTQYPSAKCVYDKFQSIKRNLASVASSGSYNDLIDRPCGENTRILFRLGSFSQYVDFDPVTGNWIDPEDSTNVKTPDEVWGYHTDAGGWYLTSDLPWDAFQYSYPDDEDSDWRDIGLEYYPYCWGGPSGYEFDYDDPDLSEIITQPSDLLNYSIKLSYNRTEMILPVQYNSDTTGLWHKSYYVGQLATGPEGDPDPTQAQLREQWTHPFCIEFILNQQETQISSISILLRVTENVAIDDVALVEVHPYTQLDSKYIPKITIGEIDSLFN